MKRHIDRIEGAHYERGYVYSFHYHLIFVTKYRRNVFTTPELVDEMKSHRNHGSYAGSCTRLTFF